MSANRSSIQEIMQRVERLSRDPAGAVDRTLRVATAIVIATHGTLHTVRIVSDSGDAVGNPIEAVPVRPVARSIEASEYVLLMIPGGNERPFIVETGSGDGVGTVAIGISIRFFSV